MEHRETYIKINKRIFNMRDGELLELQSNYGLQYKRSLGVPIYSLKIIAKEYARNNELAKHFWEHGGREQLIIASMLSDAQTINTEYLYSQLQKMHTTELQEQVTLNLLRHLNNKDTHIENWLERDDDIFQTLAILLQGHAPESFNTSRLCKILSLPTKEGSYKQKCIFRILLKLGLKNDNNYKIIRTNLTIQSQYPTLIEELAILYS